ncbi:MAG: hypothetical protein K0S74_1754 [Chlamydiales bacterium]|nr:hypothetical protein [Chlamydiales bacterium]
MSKDALTPNKLYIGTGTACYYAVSDNKELTAIMPYGTPQSIVNTLKILDSDYSLIQEIPVLPSSNPHKKKTYFDYSGICFSSQIVVVAFAYCNQYLEPIESFTRTYSILDSKLLNCYDLSQKLEKDKIAVNDDKVILITMIKHLLC